ncbi:O-antigen ligase family protein [Hoeflea sp. G2-23]|uniref:O-antigen ligase family protein n=1 Tax=Hoeflea algicola TaxID=2983763 RepID=A0ABT3Z3Y3_9HYPH|nr:O-antigen ligase [Hoeflea algicola]MCY0146472.1 O-antigen ligase family protein [Hoeflea algicola]
MRASSANGAAVYPQRRSNPALQAQLRLAHPGLLPAGTARILAIAVSTLGIALMLISLRPFAAASIFESSSADGDALNQMGFLAAGAICLLALISLANKKALASLFTPSFVALGLLIAVNVAQAPDPESTLRSAIFTIIGMLLAFSVIVLPRGEGDFRFALLIGAGAALGLSYIGVLLFPNLALHGFDVYEPQHAGLWRGHFSHKNIAGPVMSIIAFFGLYIMRSGQRLAGLIMFSAATIFVLHTGSKTTTGFFPIAIMIVLLAPLFHRSSVAIFATLVTMATVAIFTLGSLYSTEISQLVGDFLGDQTYTGRTTLWEVSLSKIPEHPWFGFGMYNFWMTDNVLGLDKPFEAAWDYRHIVHGHNNYLDILLNFGFIGGALVYWVLFIGPMFNYARARRLPGNRKLADMFFMIIVFACLLSFIETFFLARNVPLWLMHIFAVFGLHLLARFDIGRSLPDH